MDAPDLSYRRLSDFEEYRACVEIQRETWGERAEDLVPASLLSVAAKVGGVAAGAFLGGERGDPPGAADLAGFVFGLAGWRDDRRIHWSHMLAVRRGRRNRGIGRRLKALQRELLLEEGVEAAFWTYDPMVARNAHLNLNLLGATVDEFVVDMYGAGGGSPLHVGGSTDRFVVRWELQSERVRRALAGREGPSRAPAEAREIPVVDPRRFAESEGETGAGLPVDAPALRLEIPADAVGLGRENPEAGRGWRLGLRTVLHRCLSRGFRVEGFVPAREEDRGYYLLRRD